MSNLMQINTTNALDMFDAMEKSYRIADLMSKSDIIPVHFRGKAANIFIVLNSAYRMNIDPMLMMQNTFVIGGKLGMNAAFAISLANRSGLFSHGIRYRIEGKGVDLAVTAYTNLAGSDEEISYTITMKEAIADGWTKNTKYQSLPELMLRYRAATLLIRTHAPEVMNGMQGVEELEDIIAATKDVTPKKERTLQPVQVPADSEIREQLMELVVSKSISTDLVEKWCKKAGVSTLEEMSDDKMMACIEYILTRHSAVKEQQNVVTDVVINEIQEAA
ncbi:hypothetical protein Trichorick_01397 (plasmid) [Candidatus Trichorickettsia mobilis]|uniref:RecT family protein n=1 Tax=Candidatus Trichorickettsia mobilis TaxID=1346319 RepID=A0ABZ0UZG1_9RICK|nr:hypothetical protein [Candidatus Trichorickettsia mobilis]WPY01484.1 hypothetical protein Trichorick_01397 [Candidatus Trichorickettsia mobilis]